LNAGELDLVGLSRRLSALALTLVLAASGLSTRLEAQDTAGSPWAAIGGGALGAYSGAMLGTLGSIAPCSQTYSGVRCVRRTAIIGGSVGLMSGIMIGAGDSDWVAESATSAAIGFGIGAAAGLALKPIAQRVGWEDVFAVGLIGGAIGATPRGSAVGAALGTGVGIVLWRSVNGFNLPDAVGAGLAGMALGAMTEWLLTAVDLRAGVTDENVQLILPLTVSF
jgi:hypothetical protein